MANTNVILSVYQHVNAQDPTDPNIGFWVCQAAPILGSLPNTVGVGRLTKAGVVTTPAQPFATLALAQAACDLLGVFLAKQKASLLVGDPASSDAIVYGPINV